MRRSATVLATLLLTTTVACTPLVPTPAPEPDETRHAFEPSALPAPRAAAPGAPHLVLAPVRAGARLDGRRMVYRGADGRRAAFVENRWVAPPEQELADWLVAALEAAGGVAAVIAPGGRGHAELLLEAELLRLELDAAPAPGALRLELRLQLVTARDREVLATTRLRESEPLDTPGPAAMAAASGRALARLLEAAAGFVRDAVPVAGSTRG